MMTTDWTDGIARQAETLLARADESQEPADEIAAAWICKKVANLMTAGYRIDASPRLQQALRGFATEDFHE